MSLSIIMSIVVVSIIIILGITTIIITINIKSG